jgi:hypothetical protein
MASAWISLDLLKNKKKEEKIGVKELEKSDWKPNNFEFLFSKDSKAMRVPKFQANN